VAIHGAEIAGQPERPIHAARLDGLASLAMSRRTMGPYVKRQSIHHRMLIGVSDVARPRAS